MNLLFEFHESAKALFLVYWVIGHGICEAIANCYAKGTFIDRQRTPRVKCVRRETE